MKDDMNVDDVGTTCPSVSSVCKPSCSSPSPKREHDLDPRADLGEQLHRLLIKINHDVATDNFERLPLLNMEWMRLKGLYDSMKKQYE